MQQRVYEEKSGFYKMAGGGREAKHAAPLHNPNKADTAVNLSVLISPAATSDEMTFISQLGVTHVFTWVNPDQCNAAFLTDLKRRVDAAGLTLYAVSNRQLGKNASVILGFDDRDDVIAEFVAFMGALSEAGIGTTVFTWEPDGVWSTHSEVTRGGGVCRAMDAAVLAEEPLTRGRPYGDEELFGNMKYFLGAILPHAERLNVRLALHPNDPPVPSIGGVACLMRSAAAFERVFALAPGNPYLGMEFCCGCALEGGVDSFGDLFEFLPKFVRQGRVLNVHLRNVTCPLPQFAETYIDGGYGDMYKILKCLHKAQYSGTVILDHTPPFADVAGEGAATAFSVGFMKACLVAASKEAPRKPSWGRPLGSPLPPPPPPPPTAVTARRRWTQVACVVGLAVMARFSCPKALALR